MVVPVITPVVSSSPEAPKIQAMFKAISGGYDRANDILSAGIHRLWRRKVVRWSEAKSGDAVLDCATGTGDLALAFRRAVGPAATVVGSDFCAEMLQHALPKARAVGAQIQFETADVTQLPYADASFDISSIAFGIRNVQDPVKGLGELARVVRPGGRVMVLEFGQPANVLLKRLYSFYSGQVLPLVGGWITGQKDAYEYLEKSAGEFPCREEFVAMMESTGAFAKIEYQSLSGGIAYIYRGIRK